MIVHRTDDGPIGEAGWKEAHFVRSGALGSISGPVLLDPIDGATQTATLTGAVGFTLPAVPGGEVRSITLVLTNGAGFGAITVAGVKWIGGAAPTFSDTPGDINVLVLTGTSTGWIADGGPAA